MIKPLSVLQITSEQQEKLVTEWVAENCDVVIFSNYGRQSILRLFQPWEEHPEVKSFLKEYEDCYRESFRNQLENGYRPSSQHFMQHKFALRGPLKKLLIERGILGFSFTGLWGPCFYRRNSLAVAREYSESILSIFTSDFLLDAQAEGKQQKESGTSEPVSWKWSYNPEASKGDSEDASLHS